MIIKYSVISIDICLVYLFLLILFLQKSIYNKSPTRIFCKKLLNDFLVVFGSSIYVGRVPETHLNQGSVFSVAQSVSAPESFFWSDISK